MRKAISIHALLAESDELTACQNGQLLDFYPRSPCGERLKYINKNLASSVISIHALLAESDAGKRAQQTNNQISIHALLAESDLFFLLLAVFVIISIHALLAESDSLKGN